MPKTIRPDQVFADSKEDAIVFEYTVQIYGDPDAQVSQRLQPIQSF